LDLPTEILLKIFSQTGTTARDLLTLKQTSFRFKIIIQTHFKYLPKETIKKVHITNADEPIGSNVWNVEVTNVSNKIIYTYSEDLELDNLSSFLMHLQLTENTCLILDIHQCPNATLFSILAQFFKNTKMFQFFDIRLYSTPLKRQNTLYLNMSDIKDEAVMETFANMISKVQMHLIFSVDFLLH